MHSRSETKLPSELAPWPPSTLRLYRAAHVCGAKAIMTLQCVSVFDVELISSRKEIDGREQEPFAGPPMEDEPPSEMRRKARESRVAPSPSPGSVLTWPHDPHGGSNP